MLFTDIHDMGTDDSYRHQADRMRLGLCKVMAIAAVVFWWVTR